MHTRVFVIGALLVLALALTACSQPAPSPEPVSPPPSESESTPGDAAGLRLAPGLYDLGNEQVQAVGTLEYRDIEGGFWVIVGGTEGEGNVGEVVAVIENGDDLQATLEPMEGKSVMATGERKDGASIRQAGPEIEVREIEAFSDTPGIAE